MQNDLANIFLTPSFETMGIDTSSRWERDQGGLRDWSRTNSFDQTFADLSLESRSPTYSASQK